MPADADRIKSLFLHAVDLPAGQRPAFVAAVADPDERAELHRLVLAHQSPDARLDQTDPHPSGDVGQVVADRYKLLERVGEGGMGTVWMAEQRTPVKRLVALKLIRPGLDSRTVLARFEAERQALAVMDHPNIARVLDAGETSDGRPFFVMELVKGVPITRFCDEARLTPRQRLELFVPVCQAIQHAHQKGVIHRDIKPGNVLVARYDGRPVPKVIDFGVAKAAGQPLTEKTLHTGYGAVVGTPEYMSPEQASFNQLDVDTRSDVYSLGVLLYELLTGGPPFGGKELQSAGLLEMLRVVREQEPPRPSVKLSSSDRLAGLAAVRGTEPARLAGLVRGEVDWIVMKALEKDRNRRYETATGLAADVQRHLGGEPVQAVPPSVGYRLRKWARRHRGPTAAAAVVLAALLIGVAVSAAFAARAERERQRAVAARVEAEAQRQAADEQRVIADTARQAAERMMLSAQVDLDVANTSAEASVLAAARRHRLLPPAAAELRSYTASCVLALGGLFAPLLPPGDSAELATDKAGWMSQARTSSPDGHYVLCHRPGRPALLWEVRTGRVTPLQQGTESLVAAGWSDDGRLAFTDSLDGRVRLWEPATGRLRATTPEDLSRHHPSTRPFQPERYDGCFVSGNRVLTATRRQHFTDEPGEQSAHTFTTSPVGLFDADTGRLIRRLSEAGGGFPPNARLLRGTLVVCQGDYDKLLVFSARDGRLLAKLSADDKRLLRDAAAARLSPSGDRLLAVADEGAAYPERGIRLEEWDTHAWRRAGPSLPLRDFAGGEANYLDDRRVWVQTDAGLFNLTAVCEPARGLSCEPYKAVVPPARLGEQHYAAGNGEVRDLDTHAVVPKPAGRKYHPLLAGNPRGVGRLWVDSPLELADLAADKGIPLPTAYGPSSPYLPGLGYRSVTEGNRVRLMPTSAPPLPPAALELWAQVAVRGELGPAGGYTKWDEPTWQRNWRQLAAVTPPSPAFPFPGHLAHDPLHWLRCEYELADREGGKPPLARELLRRSEAAGDAPEAARWRQELRRLAPEVAPPPRPAV